MVSGAIQGLEHYRNGRKKNWRGWQWNRIVERLSVEPRDATVLYLCGPEDLDREWALKRGFRNENLIAVDLSPDNVQRVRRGGGLAICHDLNELVRAWPEDWPIDVVVADFCAGLGDSELGLVHAAVFSRGLNRVGPKEPVPVLSVNLQRGRERGDFARGVLSQHRRFDNSHTKGFNPGKHRGLMWYLLAQRGLFMGKEPPAPVLEATHAFMAPSFNSYRSNRVYMDSVVFRWPGVPGLSTGGVERRVHGVVAEARRKVAACRALRTMMARPSRIAA